METQDEIELQTPAQWKAISHPLRLRILELLATQAMTNEELAAALGEQSGKLYFHTKRLLDAGLIALDRTRQKGPITEKLYRAVARRFAAPTPVKGGRTPPLEPYLLSALELYRGSWQMSGGLPEGTEVGFHLVLPQSAERCAEFVARVRALFEDFQADASDAPDAQKISLAVVLHSCGFSKGKKDALRDGSTDGIAGTDDGDESGTGG